MKRSLSSGMGILHLQQLEAEVTPDILSTSSFSSLTSVSSSVMLVLLSDLLSSTADVTLLMITYSSNNQKTGPHVTIMDRIGKPIVQN